MQIWVDADACPAKIKDILFRAANRKKIQTRLVANQWAAIPPSPFIQSVQVAQGLDVADTYIVEHMQKGDLVITADLPLAGHVVEKEGFAINPRGKLYSKDNVKECVSMRNFNEALRSSGVMTGGPPKLENKAIQAFANTLDQFLASYS